MIGYGRERRDTCTGEVICATKYGVHLILDDGKEAFAYFNKLKRGTKVRCAINKSATENLKILVDIESVCYDDYSIQKSEGDYEYA